MIFVDTPGMHKGKDLLIKRLIKSLYQASQMLISLLFVVDRKKSSAEEHIIEYFKGQKTPVFLVINKLMNLVQNQRLMNHHELFRKL
jgi:GTP-binding protein Era